MVCFVRININIEKKFLAVEPLQIRKKLIFKSVEENWQLLLTCH